MYSLPNSCTFAALTIASAASTAPTKPLVSTIPSASRGISCVLTFLVVEIKVELLVSGVNLSPRARRIKTSEVRAEVRSQRSEVSQAAALANLASEHSLYGSRRLTFDL